MPAKFHSVVWTKCAQCSGEWLKVASLTVLPGGKQSEQLHDPRLAFASNDGNSLTIKDVRLEDEAVYMCISAPYFTETSRFETNLTVYRTYENSLSKLRVGGVVIYVFPDNSAISTNGVLTIGVLTRILSFKMIQARATL